MGFFSDYFSFHTTPPNVRVVISKVLNNPNDTGDFCRVFDAIDGWERTRAIAARNIFLCWYAMNDAVNEPKERFRKAMREGCLSVVCPREFHGYTARLGDLLVQHLDLAAAAARMGRSGFDLKQVRSFEELTNLRLPIDEALFYVLESRFGMFAQSAQNATNAAGKVDRLMFVSLIAVHIGLQIHGDGVEPYIDSLGRVNRLASDCWSILQAVFNLRQTA